MLSFSLSKTLNKGGRCAPPSGRWQTHQWPLLGANCSYVCKDGVNYHYDEKKAVGLEHERQEYLSKIYDCHATNVNCSSMNQAIEHLNASLLYFAVLKKEQGNLEEFDLSIQEMLFPLKKFEPFLFWDDLYKCIRISEMLPESFCEEEEENIRTCIEEIDDALSSKIISLEKKH